jgi:hypothetical protein
MVRDLRAFQGDRYHLPALSLPWVGRQIARRNGEDFEPFWARCFAETVGRAKARLLARYGLWYETPNPQNVLVQLDHRLRPTGTLVFRDVGDGECATDAATCVGVPWTSLREDLRAETRNSFWAFGEAGDHSIPAETLEHWYARHDQGYDAELRRWFPALAPPRDADPAARIEQWSASLRSDRAPEEIARAFQLRAAPDASLRRGSPGEDLQDRAADR